MASLTRLSDVSSVELLPWTPLPFAADVPSHPMRLKRVHCSNAAGVPGATHARSPAVLQASRLEVLSPSVPDCQVFCLIFLLRGRPDTGNEKTRMRSRRWMTVDSRGAKLVKLPSGLRCFVPSGHRPATFFRTTCAARLRKAR